MKTWKSLVRELLKSGVENECVEFKENNSDPEMIGEYISALANSATYHDSPYAYLVWGVDDKTRELTESTFNFRTKKGSGNEDLEPWLRRMLSDNANFEFNETIVDGKRIVILVIYKAIGKIVTFKNQEFIRVGSAKKKLKDYPAIESKLWSKINGAKYEEMPAKIDLTEAEVLSLIDCAAYFDMSRVPMPTTAQEIMHYLTEERLILKQDNGYYTVTNLVALLFAKRMSDFPALERKRVRIVQYEHANRLNILRQNMSVKGYANGFEEMVTYLSGLLPAREDISSPLRKEKTVYPIVAIRELIANALIHQDLTITGTGPLVEIFDNRVEITNPGVPLVSVHRILDNPPRSRNERMARMMRRLGICEELGTGWDRVTSYCESYLLPAPKIDIYEENTRVTISSPISFKNMSQDERLWTCYMHVCLKYINHEKATNASLRERFGLEKTASASASRLINLAMEKELIKPLDENTAPRYMSYVPIWA